ncbi:MAG: NAD(P)/FAD-dependent oxidoreductase, partial [Anaerolineae bacterium]
MTAEHERAEVVIVGAGPAGSTLAALLAGRGHDVLLLDRAVFPRDKTCGDGLTPRAVAALGRLGLLDDLRSNGYREIRGALLRAPDGGRWHMRFADFDLGLPAFGLVIPRRELDEHLRRHAVGRGARFRGGVDVARPLYGEARTSGRRVVAGVEARTAGGTLVVQARLTVVATGAAIGLLRAFGVLSVMPPGINAIRGYFER